MCIRIKSDAVSDNWKLASVGYIGMVFTYTEISFYNHGSNEDPSLSLILIFVIPSQTLSLGSRIINKVASHILEIFFAPFDLIRITRLCLQGTGAISKRLWNPVFIRYNGGCMYIWIKKEDTISHSWKLLSPTLPSYTFCRPSVRLNCWSTVFSLVQSRPTFS